MEPFCTDCNDVKSNEAFERTAGVGADEGRAEGGGREALRRWRVLMGNLVLSRRISWTL